MDYPPPTPPLLLSLVISQIISVVSTFGGMSIQLDEEKEKQHQLAVDGIFSPRKDQRINRNEPMTPPTILPLLLVVLVVHLHLIVFHGLWLLFFSFSI